MFGRGVRSARTRARREMLSVTSDFYLRTVSFGLSGSGWGGQAPVVRRGETFVTRIQGEDGTRELPLTYDMLEALSREHEAKAKKKRAPSNSGARVDLLLLMAKCTVPALFVAAGGAVAFLFEYWLTASMRLASEEIAAGALIVTYAFELTNGYTLHSATDGTLSLRLVAWTFAGTLLSAQLQSAAQGMWPYNLLFASSDALPSDAPPSGDGRSMGDALPFLLGYFVDGVVLAYDTPATPPLEEEEEEGGEDDAMPPLPQLSVRDDKRDAAKETAGSTSEMAMAKQRWKGALLKVRAASAFQWAVDMKQLTRGSPFARLYEEEETESAPPSERVVPSDFWLERFLWRPVVEGAAAAGRAVGSCRRSVGRACRHGWRRVRPGFSVLTFIISLDNFVSGLGILPRLDTRVLTEWQYYLAFVIAIYLGGLVTVALRRVPHAGLQAGWFALGAFSIIDGGLELITRGLTEFVLCGFMLVWLILLTPAGE